MIALNELKSLLGIYWNFFSIFKPQAHLIVQVGFVFFPFFFWLKRKEDCEMKLSLTRNCHRRMWLATPLFKGPSPGIRRPLFRLVCSPSLVHPRPCTTYAHHLLLLNRPPPPPPCANTDQVKSALNDPQQRPTFATWRPFSTRPRPFTLDFSTRNPRAVAAPLFSFFFLCFCVHLSFDNVFVFLCRFRSFIAISLARFPFPSPPYNTTPLAPLVSQVQQGNPPPPALANPSLWSQISIRLIKNEIQVNHV